VYLALNDTILHAVIALKAVSIVWLFAVKAAKTKRKMNSFFIIVYFKILLVYLGC
jgi:hypothetical protein